MTDKRKKIVAAFLLITAVGCFGIMGSILVSDGGNVGQYKTEKQSTKTTNKNKKKKWYAVLSWAVTMNLVMFGFLIFSGHLF